MSNVKIRVLDLASKRYFTDKINQALSVAVISANDNTNVNRRILLSNTATSKIDQSDLIFKSDGLLFNAYQDTMSIAGSIIPSSSNIMTMFKYEGITYKYKRFILGAKHPFEWNSDDKTPKKLFTDIKYCSVATNKSISVYIGKDDDDKAGEIFLSNVESIVSKNLGDLNSPWNKVYTSGVVLNEMCSSLNDSYTPRPNELWVDYEIDKKLTTEDKIYAKRVLKIGTKKLFDIDEKAVTDIVLKLPGGGRWELKTVKQKREDIMKFFSEHNRFASLTALDIKNIAAADGTPSYMDVGGKTGRLTRGKGTAYKGYTSIEQTMKSTTNNKGNLVRRGKTR